MNNAEIQYLERMYSSQIEEIEESFDLLYTIQDLIREAIGE